MKKKLLLVLALAVASMMLFAACSGAPGLASSPKATADEQVKAMKDEGWTALKTDATILTPVMVTGSKGEEAIIVYYCETDAQATTMYKSMEALKKIADEAGGSMEIFQNGKIVSSWAKG